MTDCADWDCEAYGERGRDIGALCFFGGEPGKRVCASAESCSLHMAVERERIFALIQAKAELGEPDFIYLAGEFTSPDQLLNSRTE